MKEKRHVAILGSTGSIGTQALEVIRANSDKFEIEVLSAYNNAELLFSQALEFKPNVVVIGDQGKYEELKDRLWKEGIKVYCGASALKEVVQMDDIDMVLTAMVGYSGLEPTIEAIKAGKQIALANKETLVVAGEMITQLAREKGVNIYPVDSEHSAIFQCLLGEFHNPIEKIILTASGGPFRRMTAADLEKITVQDALKHPNWYMGPKITIDSASMMNKGLEVIEARWLFGLQAEQIEVVIHPQSIIHSLVQFQDGSIKAQLGLPDMKLPIQFALGYPGRIKNDFPRFDFLNYPTLTFEKPDTGTFRCLQLAYDAMKMGGNIPCALNAANEIAVDAFLNGKTKFLKIAEIVEKTMHATSFISRPGLNDYIATDNEARKISAGLL